MKVAQLDGKIMNIISYEECVRRVYQLNEWPNILDDTAVECECNDGSRYILPWKKNSNSTGISLGNGELKLTILTKDDDEIYRSQNVQVIDMQGNITDFIEKTKQIRNLDAGSLSDPETIFNPVTKDTDSPEMKAFKEAIRRKGIDINKYSSRFGDNFLNDKRILKGGSITLNKAVKISEALDIRVDITFSDASPDVPNPMGESITATLTRKED